jgi:hypothetical protein
MKRKITIKRMKRKLKKKRMKRRLVAPHTVLVLNLSEYLSLGNSFLK